MLPFVGIDDSKIAPFHPYGICVAIGFFLGESAMMNLALRRGYDRKDFRVIIVLMGVLGWGFAWAVDYVFYHPEHLEQGISALQGFSSTGAIVGATIAAIFWARFDLRGWKFERRSAPHKLLPAAECVLGGWALAFAFGRLGCSLVHDHVGAAATPGTLGSLFAIGFPRGAGDGIDHVWGPIHVVFGASDLRYDLGFLELLVLAPMAALFAVLAKRKIPMGTFTIVSCLVYGPVRFVLDFLRPETGPSGEARQGGLTFAQYWSVAVVALGVVLLVRLLRAAPTPIEPEKAAS